MTRNLILALSLLFPVIVEADPFDPVLRQALGLK